MSLPKVATIISLEDEQIEKEILIAKKELFELRLLQGTRQSFKPHTFHHIKHRLGQLLMIKRQRLSTNEAKD